MRHIKSPEVSLENHRKT